MRSGIKPELLSPAGDREKLKTVIQYGADAVYMGAKQFSLRQGAGNFSLAEMSEAVGYAHERGVKVYAAVNIFAMNDDINEMRGYIQSLSGMDVDALIISDPGVFRLAKDIAPGMDIHISTQANVTNGESVRFWHSLGASRVNLARELSLDAIRAVSSQAVGVELEAFVHGAMCVAYSGRCLLSAYLTSRSANKGDCAHPCRYRYALMEEKRPGQYFPVTEDERGVTLLASKDLCMVAHLPKLISAGVDCFKIEGRMKSSFYAAMTTKVYRHAIDDYFEDPALYEKNKPEYIRQLSMCAHRGYGFTTGFYFGLPSSEAQDYADGVNNGTHVFAGVVRAYHKQPRGLFDGIPERFPSGGSGDFPSGFALVEQRNKLEVGDIVEVIRARGDHFIQRVTDMRGENGQPLSGAPHPKQQFYVKMDRPVAVLDIIAKAVE